MSDNTKAPESVVESQAPSSIALAILGIEDQAAAPQDAEQVKSEAVTEEKTSEPQEEGVQAPDQSSVEESEETEEVVEEEAKDDTEKEKDKKTFEVAGTKYDTFEEAVQAVSRISGDNTRLAGDLKVLRSDLTKKDAEISTFQATIDSLQTKLKEWQEYYDDGETGEKPNTKVDIDAKVQEAIAAIEAKKEAEAKQKQYEQQFEEIEAMPDFAEVFPFMQDAAKELGDALTSVAPKKLYAMARGLYFEANPDKRVVPDNTVLDTAKKIADQKTEKQLNRSAAKKVLGGGGRQTQSAPPQQEISPLAAVLLGH